MLRKRFLTLIAAGIANYTSQYANLVCLLEFYYFQTTQEVYMRRIYLLFIYLILTDVYLVTQLYTRVGTLIVATIYLQLTQNRYMFRSFTVLQCSHQHCVQPVASDVEVVGYL